MLGLLALALMMGPGAMGADAAAPGRVQRPRISPRPLAFPQRPATPSERGLAARALPLEGGFFARLRGWGRWQYFRHPVSLEAGDELRIPPESRVELQLPGGATLRTRREVWLRIDRGVVRFDRGLADVRVLEGPLTLATPLGSLRASHARFTADLGGPGPRLQTRVLSGVVAVHPAAGGPPALVGTGREVLLLPEGPPAMRRLPYPLIEELERFAATGPTPRVPDRPIEARPLPPRLPAGAEPPAPGRDSSNPTPRAETESKAPGRRQAAVSLRDRMLGLRNRDYLLLAYAKAAAERTAAELADLERGLAGAGRPPTLLEAHVAEKRKRTLLRQRHDLQHARLALQASEHRKRFDEGQSRDELLASRREEALGRPIWLQTRQAVGETRTELDRLEVEISGLNSRIAALGPAPADPAALTALVAQRDAAIEQANLLGDSAEELIEVQ